MNDLTWDDVARYAHILSHLYPGAQVSSYRAGEPYELGTLGATTSCALVVVNVVRDRRVVATQSMTSPWPRPRSERQSLSSHAAIHAYMALCDAASLRRDQVEQQTRAWIIERLRHGRWGHLSERKLRRMLAYLRKQGVVTPRQEGDPA